MATYLPPAPEKIRLRTSQAQILDYAGGRMGISAVPGSGKTFTLCCLAAKLIGQLARAQRLDEQEVLIVTFSRSAVHNFRARIDQLVSREGGQLPGAGYSVRTLHSLAHEIVRTNPSLVNLGEDFVILDGARAERYMKRAAQQVLADQPDLLAGYYTAAARGGDRETSQKVQNDAADLAGRLVAEAKLRRLDPETLAQRLRIQPGTWPLLEFALAVHTRYQAYLWELHALDFADLMHYAVEIVDQDVHLCTRLQHQWPFILEDEAQDSSLLQEALLARLTRIHGNWVRVGDRNQAIHTTFTGADPRLLAQFIKQKDTIRRTLSQSGRCDRQIMDCANVLVRWSQRRYRQHDSIDGLTPTFIQPTDEGDPQPNPSGERHPVVLVVRSQTQKEADGMVIRNLCKWLAESGKAETQTAAILVPDNRRGDDLRRQLMDAAIPIDDSLMRTTRRATEQARKLECILDFIVEPSLRLAKQIWSSVWSPVQNGQEWTEMDGNRQPDLLPQVLAASWEDLSYIEDWMQLSWPEPAPSDAEAKAYRVIEMFRTTLDRWAGSVVLPIDEIMILIGHDIFTEPKDIALAHRLALHLYDHAHQQPEATLKGCLQELRQLVAGKTRHTLLHDVTGYEARPGRITISTIHSAKGLEWDRVYLLGINSLAFPSDPEQDSFVNTRHYVRNSLDLVAEGEALVQQLAAGALEGCREGPASYRARCAYIDERLRLFYVGITRARRSLVILSDTGRHGQQEPAQALEPLLHLNDIHVLPAA